MSFLKKAQQHVAHTSKLPALGNQDLRQLQDIIISEKNFIQSNTKAAADFKKNAEAIKAWSAEEGPDLNDVVGKVSLLYDHYTASQNRLNSHLTTVRLHFKSIRTREEALSDLKARKRSLGSDIEKVEKKLAKMGPENKDLMRTTASLKEMRTEMEGMHVEVMNEEAAIGDFKRRTIRESLGIKSGALLEMAEKLTIIAEISKLMLDEIPLHPTQPGMPRAEYYGFAKTESLLQEATRCIADVGFNPSARCALRDGSHQTAWHYANSRRGERVGRQVSGGLHRLCLARTMRSPWTSPHPIVAAAAAAAAAAAGSAFFAIRPSPSPASASPTTSADLPRKERRARANPPSRGSAQRPEAKPTTCRWERRTLRHIVGRSLVKRGSSSYAATKPQV
jgi:hypothetical protein